MSVTVKEELMAVGSWGVDLDYSPSIKTLLVDGENRPRKLHALIYDSDSVLVYVGVMLAWDGDEEGLHIGGEGPLWHLGAGEVGPMIVDREYVSGFDKLSNGSFDLASLYWRRPSEESLWVIGGGQATNTGGMTKDDVLESDEKFPTRPGNAYRFEVTEIFGVGAARARIIFEGKFDPPNMLVNPGFELGPGAGWSQTSNITIVSGGRTGSYGMRIGPIPKPNLEPNPTFAAGWTLGPDMAVTAAGLVLSSNTRLQLMSDLEDGDWDDTAPDVGIVHDPAHAFLPGSLGDYVAKIGPNVKHQVFTNADFEGVSTPVQPFLRANGKPPTALRAAAGMKLNGRRHAVRRPVTDPRALAAMSELARQPVPSVPRAASSRAFSGRTKTATTVRRYLARFGYLPPETLSLAADERTDLDDELAGGLRRYQRFFGLRQTGKVDDATVEMMGRPRCGYPDIAPTFPGLAESIDGRRTFVPGPGGPWADRSLTYGFSAYVADVPTAQQETAIVDAFNQWSFAAPDLSFTLVAIGTPPQIIFGVDPNVNPSTLAYATYPSDGGDINYIDDPWNWGINPNVGGGANDFDYGRVATHEIGHALGLDHTDVSSAIMWPVSYQGNQPNALDPDDAAGILFLYPTGAPPPGPPPGPPPAPPPAGGIGGLDYWHPSSTNADPDPVWYSDPGGGVNGSDAATTRGLTGGPLIKYLRANSDNGPGAAPYTVKPGESYEAESYLRCAPSTTGTAYISVMIPHPSNGAHDLWWKSQVIEAPDHSDDRWNVLTIGNITVPGTRTKLNGLLEAHDHDAGYLAFDNFILTRTKGNRRTIYSATPLTFVPGTQYRIAGVVIAGDNHQSGDATWGVKFTNGDPVKDVEATVTQGNKDFEWAFAHTDVTPDVGYTSGLPFVSAIDVDGDSIYLDRFWITRWTNNISTAYGTAFPVLEDQNYQFRSSVASNAGALQGKATVGYILSGPGVDDEVVSEDVEITNGEVRAVTKDVKTKVGYTTAQGFVRSTDINGNESSGGSAAFTVSRLDFIKTDGNSDSSVGTAITVTPERAYHWEQAARSGANLQRGTVKLSARCTRPGYDDVIFDSAAMEATNGEWKFLTLDVTPPSGYDQIVPSIIGIDVEGDTWELDDGDLRDTDTDTVVADSITFSPAGSSFFVAATAPLGSEFVRCAIVLQSGSSGWVVNAASLARTGATPATGDSIIADLLKDPATLAPLSLAAGAITCPEVIPYDWHILNLTNRAALDHYCTVVSDPPREFRVVAALPPRLDVGTAAVVFTDHAPGSAAPIVLLPDDIDVLDLDDPEASTSDRATEIQVIGAERRTVSGQPILITATAVVPGDPERDYNGRPIVRRRIVSSGTVDHFGYAEALAFDLAEREAAPALSLSVTLSGDRTRADCPPGDWIYAYHPEAGLESQDYPTHIGGEAVFPRRVRVLERTRELGPSYKIVMRSSDGATFPLPGVLWSEEDSTTLTIGDRRAAEAGIDPQGHAEGVQYLRDRASRPR